MSENKGKVLGVGGIFFRSGDPARLGDWYQEHLGFQVEEWGDTRGTSFAPSDMPPASFTVWSAFAAGTAYFGPSGWFVDPDGNRVELWEPPEAE